MSHTAERIETIKLWQSLGGADEAPGEITLRALRLADRLKDREAVCLRGLNALKHRYPNDLAFSNAGFTLGVVRAIVDGILEG